jgi:hypothetical protein
MDLDEEIDRLYGTPLDEFVRERDELARRLTRDGDREAAARVKALRKPTVGAWALNQAVRRRRVETNALIATGKRLRAAHEDLLTGGDPAVLRETMDEERSLTSSLADCAEAIASETGKAGPALRDRVRATLHAAAVDEEAREQLAAGRFTREREAVGLGGFGGELPAAAATAAPRRKAQPKGGRSATKPEQAPEPEPGPDPRLADAEHALAEARAELSAAEADHAATISRAETAREELEQADEAEREARRIVRERWREVSKHERRVERYKPKT